VRLAPAHDLRKPVLGDLAGTDAVAGRVQNSLVEIAGAKAVDGVGHESDIVARIALT